MSCVSLSLLVSTPLLRSAQHCNMSECDLPHRSPEAAIQPPHQMTQILSKLCYPLLNGPITSITISFSTATTWSIFQGRIVHRNTDCSWRCSAANASSCSQCGCTSPATRHPPSTCFTFASPDHPHDLFWLTLRLKTMCLVSIPPKKHATQRQLLDTTSKHKRL